MHRNELPFAAFPNKTEGALGERAEWKVGCLLDRLLKGGTRAMLAISLFCAALGVAVGTRFKILVLGPAFVLALVSNISFGIAAGGGFREMAATLLISLVALQVGYLAGSLVSHFVSTVRFKRAIVWMPRYHL